MMIDVDLLLTYGATYKKISKGEIIFTEGDNCSFYYQLLTGRVNWLNINDDRPFYFRGRLKFFNKDFDNALIDFNEAIKLNKNDPDYFIGRAKVYMFNDNEYDDELGEDDLYTALKLGSEKAKELLDEYYSEDDENN